MHLNGSCIRLVAYCTEAAVFYEDGAPTNGTKASFNAKWCVVLLGNNNAGCKDGVLWDIDGGDTCLAIGDIQLALPAPCVPATIDAPVYAEVWA